MSEQTMRETDLLAFEIANEIGKPGSVMCSYNRVNGVYACEDKFLLLDVLRRDWGFPGFVMSDWGAHLPVTWPARLEQLPQPVLPDSNVPRANAEVRRAFGFQADRMPFELRYPEGRDIGYRWFEKTKAKQLYPFGYGLSYSAFRYDRLKATGGRQLKVRFRVTNIGDRDGADVPQVYVSPPGRTKRLVGWTKPYLKAGESTMVTITSDPRLIGEFDQKWQRWSVREGRYGIDVAHDAGDAAQTSYVAMSHREVRP
jgi:beta-glucosidase